MRTRKCEFIHKNEELKNIFFHSLLAWEYKQLQCNTEDKLS